MKESITNKRILKVMVGFLVIGGLAAIFRIYRAAKHPEMPSCYV